MIKKPLLASLTLAVVLAGCGAPVRTASAAGAPTAAFAAASLDESLDDEEKSVLDGALSTVAGEMADGVDASAAASAPAVGPKGSLLYRAFAKSKILRGLGAALSEGIVYRYFSKPGKDDDVPRLSAEEIQTMAGLVKPGDLIQCGNNASFVHVAFYEGDGMITHALAQSGFGRKMIGVRRERLVEYFERVDRDKVVVLRPTWTPEKLAEAVKYARAQEGKPYDTLFIGDSDDRHYCTELAWHILTDTGVARVEPHLVTKAGWRLITNEDIRKSPDLQVVWTRNHD